MGLHREKGSLHSDTDPQMVDSTVINEVEILKMMGKGKHVGSITMCWKAKSEKVEKKG